MTQRLVVIGGDAAGMSAAAQVRRLRGREELDVVVFERGRYTSYAACGLPYLVAGEVASPDDLVARSPEEHRARGVDVRTRHEVRSIDVGSRTLAVIDLDTGDERVEPYDDLLVATGATPVRPPLPGIDASGVFDLRTLPDAAEVDRALTGAGTAVVVGAGYVGLEVAEALRARGAQVVLVEQADRPMTSLDPEMSALVAEALQRLGVRAHFGATVHGFDTDDRGSVRAVDTDAGTFDSPLVVLGLGARPASELARAAGIGVGDHGGIVVDRSMRTDTDGVWAAGDCVGSFHRVARRDVVIGLGTHANRQGRVAGTNLGGGHATFEGVLGTAITRVGDLEVARTGLSVAEAAEAGLHPVAVTHRSSTAAGYMPGADEVVVRVVCQAGSGRLLGAQIVGGAGAAKRIDVFATALWNDMTVAEVAAMDLSYAPPFSPVWDPVSSAAARAAVEVAAQ
jgi:NADPH-dependent 2,4-dienoyl-CoA reductase/sulfur reductase-like enzyme